MADVNIKINVDTTNATGKISDVRKELAQTAVAAQKADSNIEGVSTVMKGLGISAYNTSTAIKQTNIALETTAVSADTAAVAMETATVATAGTSLALEALEAVLTGGILLAITAVIGVVITFAKKLFETIDPIEQLDNRLNSLQENIDKVSESFSRANKEAAELGKLAKLNLQVAGVKGVDLIKQGQAIDIISVKNEINKLQTALEGYKREAEAIDKVTFSLGLSEEDYQKSLEKRGKVSKAILDITSQLKIEQIKLNEIDAQAAIEVDKLNNKQEKHLKTLKAIKEFQAPLIFTNVKVQSSDEILAATNKAAEEQARAEQKAINETLKKYPLTLKWQLDLTPDAFRVQIEQMNYEIAKMLSAFDANAFASLGEGIGSAIGKGTNVIQSAFQSLIGVIGAGLEQLGKAMVGLGTAKEAIEKFNFVPGAGTVIAGVATIILGAILKNIKLPGFADGVTNFGGGMAIVGERGPELVRLPRGSDVIPNHLIGDVGMGQQIYIPAITLRGQDLVLAFNRASATINRNG